jgi:APA family basic amino acid/polyamine antiporter
VSDKGFVRAIGRFDLTAAIVNGVIGSAIFGMPARIAELTGVWSPLAYLAAGLGVMTMVLCFAEVASRFQDPGGPYLYAREAFGPWVGFQAGWLTFWIRVTSVAANINVLASYLAETLPAAASPQGRALTMALVLGAITAINVAGVRQATWTIDVLTVLKLMPLLLLIALGLARLSPEVLASQRVLHPDWTSAILLLVYAYGGFEAPLIPAGESKNPRRDTAFALFAALAVIASLYMLVQLAVVGVVPGVAAERAPIAAAFERLLGPSGRAFASFAAVLSVIAWATGSVLQSPRVLYSIAERRELPALFARIHPRFRTPHVAIVVYSTLALGLALYGSFEWNATLSAIVRLVTYGLTCIALPVLRRRADVPAPGFRLPLPAAALAVPAGVGFALWLLLTRSFARVWILPALMGVGALLYAARPGRRIAAA